LDYCSLVKTPAAVLANGNIVRVCRPNHIHLIPCSPTLKDFDNAELFAGVLGGGPGSFAVVVEYDIDTISDAAASPAWGTADTLQYHRGSFEQLLKEMQKWTVAVATNDKSSLGDNMDFFATVIKGKVPILPKVGVVLLEMATSKDTSGAGKAMLEGISERVFAAMPWWKRWIKKSTPSSSLSQIAHRGVRDMPDGREFPEPYKKRVNGFREAMTDAFIEGFLDIIDEVFEEKNAKLVIQMMVAGGAYKANEHDGTGLPFRDLIWGFVFDIFYKNGDVEAAERLQAKVAAMLKTAQKSDGDHVRLLWGSFGNTNMSNSKIWPMYYGEGGVYPRMQQLKQHVDPQNIFATSFTVQPPLVSHRDESDL
jgi:FAD/FMN-containing dehydrogenase